MKRKTNSSYLILCILTAILFVAGTKRLHQLSNLAYLKENPITTEEFRGHELDDSTINKLCKSKNVGEDVALELLNKHYGKTEEFIWKNGESWEEYLSCCKAIWNDVKVFPLERKEVTYGNSWMGERTYGGKRGHEGCDLMTKENIAGIYPIYSMTDGIVTNKGWLDKGGYRIGITAPSGGYFYYAHLDSYVDIKEGDTVKAGQILGYAGDTGYGPEGTTGKFPVHLHLGIYIYPEGKEISVNPYWVLQFVCKKVL